MSRNLPSLNALLAFEAAARHLSFKEAAEELFVTQSAISHRIKSLEELLEAPLFVRHPQSVELTLRGSEYFEQVTFFLSGIENSTQKARRKQLGGPLYIQASPAFASFWLLPRLIRFNQAYPDIDVNLTTIATPESPAVHPFDLRINCAWEEPPEKGGEPLMDSSHVPVCHPDFLTAGRVLQSAEEMFDYRFIKTADPWDDWHVWFNSQGITDFSGLQGPVMENNALTTSAAPGSNG